MNIKKNNNKISIIIFFIFLCFLISTLFAAGKINYSALLSQKGVLLTGEKNITFSIYDRSTEGTLLWTSGVKKISAVEGKINYVLGSDPIFPDSLFADNTRLYLEIKIEDEILAPREEILKNPYSEITGSISLDSIASHHIQSNTIEEIHLSSEIITAEHIKDNSITSEDIVSLAWAKLTDVPTGGGGTEVDPIFTASASYTIATSSTTDWNMAYSWGDHSKAGYASPAEITSIKESTGVIKASLDNVIVSTGSLQTQINAIDVSNYATKAEVAMDTNTLRTDLNAVILSTGELKTQGDGLSSQIANVIVSTGELKTQIDAIDVSNYAVKADVISATNTLRIDVSAIQVSTGELVVVDSLLKVSTGELVAADSTLQSNIAGVIISTGELKTQIDAINTGSFAVKADVDSATGTLRLEVDALEVSTGELVAADSTLQSNIDSVIASTGELKIQSDNLSTQVGNVIVSTGELKTQIDAIDTASFAVKADVISATNTLRTNIDNIIVSTGNLKTQSDNLSTQVGNVIVSIATSAFVA